MNLPAVVGNELSFINFLANDFSRLEGVKVDYKNGYLVIKSLTDADKILLSAHIDRHGLITNGKGSLEYAAYRTKREKYSSPTAIEKENWQKIRERFIGESVFAYHKDTGKPLVNGCVEDCYLCPVRDNFVFSVTELTDLEADIPVGFDNPYELNSNYVTGQLDNVISVALGYYLFANGFKGTMLLTCEEEIGQSWRYIADYLQKEATDSKLLVLDTSPFDEDANFDDTSIVLRTRDQNSEFDINTVNWLSNIANGLNLPIIFKDTWLLNGGSQDLGSTELGRLLSETDVQQSATTLQIPSRGYHTNREKISQAAMANFLKIFAAIN